MPLIPEVPRPDVVNNSTVLLVEASKADAVFVRPSNGDSQRQYDAVLQDVLLYGTKGALLLRSCGVVALLL